MFGGGDVVIRLTKWVQQAARRKSGRSPTLGCNAGYLLRRVVYLGATKKGPAKRMGLYVFWLPGGPPPGLPEASGPSHPPHQKTTKNGSNTSSGKTPAGGEDDRVSGIAYIAMLSRTAQR